MSNKNAHAVEHSGTDYMLLGKILVLLMFFTFATITITELDFGTLTLTVALLIAGVKSYFVIAYFMHLKHEGLLLKILVISVFILYILIVLITLIDYYYR
ncbi:MAG: cytochrome C oxidase subunit IV family protein [Bacteroidales bacterium]|nr:cytochrome C oxidase subunit IV family protein [Bacteroidales bacterium]